jgi:hypothetical protein
MHGPASQVTDLGDGTVLRIGAIPSERPPSWAMAFEQETGLSAPRQAFPLSYPPNR